MKLEFECWPIDEATPRNKSLYLYWPTKGGTGEWMKGAFDALNNNNGLWHAWGDMGWTAGWLAQNQPTHWAYTIPGPVQEAGQ
jgi:hypothetical protein